jgi:hypothetical protein
VDPTSLFSQILGPLLNSSSDVFIRKEKKSSMHADLLYDGTYSSVVIIQVVWTRVESKIENINHE